MANEQPKKKGSIAHKIYAVLIILLGVMILAMGVIILFHTQSIEVEGLEYNSEQEIVDWVRKDEASANTLYLLWKYNMQKPKLLPFLDSVSVRLKAPWAVSIEAEEKKIVAYIEAEDGYYYFDKKGLVILVNASPIDGIPRIEGMEIENMALYKKLKAADDRVFEHILDVTQLLKKEELKPDRILCDGKNVTLYFGTICVELGSSGYSHKIVQLPMVLEKLAGQTGVLRMKHYSANSKYISFRQVDPDAVPEEGADGEASDTESGEDAEGSETDGEGSGNASDGEGSGDSLDYGDNIDSSESNFTYGNDGEE